MGVVVVISEVCANAFHVLKCDLVVGDEICIFGDNDTALTVSTMLNGEYGISDICLSLLTVVGQEGVKFRIPSHLSDEELAKLHHSADCLRKVIDQIKF